MSGTTFKITAVSSSGAITGVSVANPGTGYTVGSPFTLSVHKPVTALQVSNDHGNPIFSISMQGEVTWHQNLPNEAANKLVTSIQGIIDMKSAGELAMARSYLRGVEKCLKLAETLTHSELILALQTEVEHRNSKLTWHALKESLETTNDS